MCSCHTTEKVGKPNQTVRKTIEGIKLQSNSQFKIEYGGAKKKSLVREAILKFSEKPEKIPKMEIVPKTKAPKSEFETQGVAPEEDLIQIVKYNKTKPKLTNVNQPKPNPCNPPIPKTLVRNNHTNGENQPPPHPPPNTPSLPS